MKRRCTLSALVQCRRGRAGVDLPAARMFGRARLHLTLWYALVLVGALSVFGVVLYVGAQRTLMGPVDRRLVAGSRLLGRLWQAAPILGCPPERYRRRANVTAWGCFSSQGTLTGSGGAPTVTARFYDQSIVQAALRSGSAVRTVAGANESGTMRIRARVIADPVSGGTLGVLLVGVTIQSQIDVLAALLHLLLALGGATLLAATAGGLLLSGRALAPVRRALVRQQEFIADASHELRTPLTLVRADAEVLLRARDRFSADDAALLEDIVAESIHMGALATNLLALARMDAGHQQIEREEIDLRALTAALVRRIGPYAAAQGVVVALQPEATLPDAPPLHGLPAIRPGDPPTDSSAPRADSAGPVLVSGDRSLIEQAILILLDNAVKYNRRGGRVLVRLTASPPAIPVRVQLEVIDTGVGIAPQHLPRLGDRFYRVDKARSRETGGAGLGLSIARGIVALHRGSIAIDSEPDRGTTAALILPLARR